MCTPDFSVGSRGGRNAEAQDMRTVFPLFALAAAAVTGGRDAVYHMPSADLTSWDPLFKDDYHSGAIINSLQDENHIQDFMTSQVADESWQGRKKVVPIKVGRNHSTGSIGSRGALPQQGRSAYADFEIPMRDLYGRVGFDKYVMLQSRNKKGAFAEVVSQEMDGLVEDMAFQRNVIAWGYGSGILAKVNGTHTATTTLEVKDPLNVTGTTNANRYLMGDSVSGMFIAILDGSTPTTIKGTGIITAVNADGTDVTLDTAITAAAGDYIVRAQTATQNSYNKEPEGLLSMVDDGTYVSTYHALSRTTYPILKSYVVTGVGALSLDAIQQCIDANSIRTGGTQDMLVSEHAVRRAYLALLEYDRRYTGVDLKSPDGGTKAAKKPSGKGAITYGDIPWLVERDCPYGMLFGLKKDTFVRYYEDDGGWADEEGSVLKWVDGFDEYTAFYRLFENYHCHKPAKNWRMEGITVNQLIVRSF